MDAAEKIPEEIRAADSAEESQTGTCPETRDGFSEGNIDYLKVSIMHIHW